MNQGKSEKINTGKQYGNQSDQGKNTTFHFDRHNSCPKPPKRKLEGNLEDLNIHDEILTSTEPRLKLQD